MSLKKVTIIIGILAAAIFLSFIAVFFFTLNTTISDFSGGDAQIANQLYYNFFHGRPFQFSIWPGDSRYLVNPYPYFNVLVWHSHILSTAIVSFFYIFHSGINTMYAVFIILNYISFAFFTFKIIERLSTSDVNLKSILAFSVFLLSGYLGHVLCKGAPLMMCGPFILAAYYFLKAEKKTAFFLTIVSLCLIQDDLAIFAITFLIVLLLFEKRCKNAIYLSLAFSVGYIVVWYFMMQPFLRHDLVFVNHGSSLLLSRFYEVVGMLSSWRPDPKKWLIVFSPFYLSVLAAILIYRFFGRPGGLPWPKILSFIFLAPAAYWVYGSFTLSGPHLLPVLVMTYLAFLVFVGAMRFDRKKRVGPTQAVILLIAACIFLCVNFMVMTPALPFSPRISAWKVVKHLTGIEIFKSDGFRKKMAADDEWRKQIPFNKAAIKAVNSIPKDRSIVFLGNYTARGLISDRNDIWVFPMYYDLADFLVIEKGSKYCSFSGEDLENLDYKRPELREKFYNTTDGVLSDKLIEKIKKELIDNKHTHRVMRDDGYVLILERLARYKFYMPKASMGFGFMENIFKGKEEALLK